MTRLAHVCIESADLDATERFYNVLGATRRFEFRNPRGLLIGYYLQFDNRTFLEVIRVEAVRAEGAVRHFAIECDDVAAVREALLAAGFTASDKRLGGDHTWMVTCTDPNGVCLELHEYGPASMQQHGGTCVIDYNPRPRAP